LLQIIATPPAAYGLERHLAEVYRYVASSVGRKPLGQTTGASAG